MSCRNHVSLSASMWSEWLSHIAAAAASAAKDLFNGERSRGIPQDCAKNDVCEDSSHSQQHGLMQAIGDQRQLSSAIHGAGDTVCKSRVHGSRDSVGGQMDGRLGHQTEDGGTGRFSTANLVRERGAHHARGNSQSQGQAAGTLPSQRRKPNHDGVLCDDSGARKGRSEHGSQSGDAFGCEAESDWRKAALLLELVVALSVHHAAFKAASDGGLVVSLGRFVAAGECTLLRPCRHSLCMFVASCPQDDCLL